MNGLDPCPTCGHDQEFAYTNRHGSRLLRCRWCQMAKNELQRQIIGTQKAALPLEELVSELKLVRFSLARQGMERVTRELEAEGVWL